MSLDHQDLMRRARDLLREEFPSHDEKRDLLLCLIAVLPCEECGAEPGKSCRTKTGGRRKRHECRVAESAVRGVGDSDRSVWVLRVPGGFVTETRDGSTRKRYKGAWSQAHMDNWMTTGDPNDGPGTPVGGTSVDIYGRPCLMYRPASGKVAFP